MGSAKGNVPVLSDGGTHHSWCWDEKNMVYRRNKSFGDLQTGDVVVRHDTIGKGFKTTTTEGDTTVIGVIPQVEPANGNIADLTIEDEQWGYVQFAGDIAKVNVDRACTLFSFLIASETPKKATPVAAWQAGVFGIALGSTDGEGQVQARLFPVQNATHAGLTDKGENTHEEIDDHISASAEVHGLPANVAVIGSRNGAGIFVQHGTAVISGGAAAVTWPVPFPHACVGVWFTGSFVGGTYSNCVQGLSTTGATLRLSVDTTVYWLAMGY